MPVSLRVIGRDARNVPGDFYIEDSCCLSCGLAEIEAPDLIASVEEVTCCYFKKQPATPEELEQAIKAMWVSEVACPRYGGTDPAILHRLKAQGLQDQCDHPLPPKG